MWHEILFFTLSEKHYIASVTAKLCWSVTLFKNQMAVQYSFVCMLIGSSEAVEDATAEISIALSAAERQNQIQQRANATVHVCWHRNTSVNAKDLHVALHVCHLVCHLCRSPSIVEFCSSVVYFKTNNVFIVSYCHMRFHFHLSSAFVEHCSKNFIVKCHSCDNFSYECV